MCTEAAEGHRSQSGREYGFGVNIESEQATKLSDLSPDQLDII